MSLYLRDFTNTYPEQLEVESYCIVNGMGKLSLALYIPGPMWDALDANCINDFFKSVQDNGHTINFFRKKDGA